MGTSFLSSEEYDELAHQHYDAGEYDEALRRAARGAGAVPRVRAAAGGPGVHARGPRGVRVGAPVLRAGAGAGPRVRGRLGGAGRDAAQVRQRGRGAASASGRSTTWGWPTTWSWGSRWAARSTAKGCSPTRAPASAALSAAHPDSAELAAARGYTLHALGDDLGARRELRRAVRLDAELHEARIYLSHLLHDRGDLRGGAGGAGAGAAGGALGHALALALHRAQGAAGRRGGGRRLVRCPGASGWRSWRRSPTTSTTCWRRWRPASRARWTRGRRRRWSFRRRWTSS